MTGTLTTAVRLALLGDSIAWGQGAALPGDRLGPRLTEALQAQGVMAVNRVFAVPGARSRDLDQQVDQALTWNPHLALVVTGANDLTHREPVDTTTAAVERAVRRIRDAGAEVVVAPAPDLGSVPHVPVSLRRRRPRRERRPPPPAGTGRRRGRGHIADPDQRSSRAFASDPTLFSADRFHPSSAGDAVIADALLPAVTEAQVRACRRAAAGRVI